MTNRLGEFSGNPAFLPPKPFNLTAIANGDSDGGLALGSYIKIKIKKIKNKKINLIKISLIKISLIKISLIKNKRWPRPRL